MNKAVEAAARPSYLDWQEKLAIASFFLATLLNSGPPAGEGGHRLSGD